MADPKDPSKDLQARKQAIYDEEDYKIRVAGMSDDEILSEWERARKALSGRGDAHEWWDLEAAPGEPLAGSMKRSEIPQAQGRSRLDTVARVPVGSPLDTNNTWQAGWKDEADGLALLERPFSALTTELNSVNPKSEEYKRVQALYGPARLAYARKNNLSLNTGEPKKPAE